jgi:hypothetical protein
MSWFKVSNAGTTRWVMCTGSIAWKIAKDQRGVSANISESGVWRRSKQKQNRRSGLCPSLTLLLGGLLLIANRAIPLTQEEFDGAFERGELPEWDYLPPDDESEPFEYKADAWGWYEDRIVAIDYANTQSHIGKSF